jgi:hypothetical protein
MAEEREGERLARFVAFATLGTVSTAEDIARHLIEQVEGIDAELAVEETLCLVATATARAAELGAQEDPARLAAAPDVIMNLPVTYRDYMVGGLVMEKQNPALLQTAGEILTRLRRKQEFYAAHFPPNQFPGERALGDKMALWMGRVSPPGLPDMPGDRLERLGLVPLLLVHLRLVLAFARQPDTA